MHSAEMGKEVMSNIMISHSGDVSFLLRIKKSNLIVIITKTTIDRAAVNINPAGD